MNNSQNDILTAGLARRGANLQSSFSSASTSNSFNSPSDGAEISSERCYINGRIHAFSAQLQTKKVELDKARTDKRKEELQKDIDNLNSAITSLSSLEDKGLIEYLQNIISAYRSLVAEQKTTEANRYKIFHNIPAAIEKLKTLDSNNPLLQKNVPAPATMDSPKVNAFIARAQQNTPAAPAQSQNDDNDDAWGDKEVSTLVASIKKEHTAKAATVASSSSTEVDLSQSKIAARNLLLKILNPGNEEEKANIKAFFKTLLKANDSKLIANFITALNEGELEQAYTNAKAFQTKGITEVEFKDHLQKLEIHEWYEEQLAAEKAEAKRQADEAAAEQQRQAEAERQRQAVEAKRVADEHKRQIRQTKAEEASKELDKNSLQNFFSETLEDENSINSIKAYNTKLQEAEARKSAIKKQDEDVAAAHEKIGDEAAKGKRNQIFKIVGATIVCGALIVGGVYLYKNPQTLSKASTAISSCCSKAKESSIAKSAYALLYKLCTSISSAFGISSK